MSLGCKECLDRIVGLHSTVISGGTPLIDGSTSWRLERLEKSSEIGYVFVVVVSYFQHAKLRRSPILLVDGQL